MAKNSAARNERRRAMEDAWEAEALAKAEEQARKDGTPLEFLIDEVRSWEEVQYVLKRLAKAVALQTELLKRVEL
jgi:hypothetical protein